MKFGNLETIIIFYKENFFISTKKNSFKELMKCFFLTCTKYIVLFKSDLKCFNGRFYVRDVKAV